MQYFCQLCMDGRTLINDGKFKEGDFPPQLFDILFSLLPPLNLFGTLTEHTYSSHT